MRRRGYLKEGRSFPFEGSRKRFIQERVSLEDGQNLGRQVAGAGARGQLVPGAGSSNRQEGGKCDSSSAKTGSLFQPHFRKPGGKD